MSIATLKKKTQTLYINPMSIGHAGFSLNGTHRSQGYVGQTSLSRSLPRTLAKGATLKGHGGCCGKYPVYPSILSAVTSTEDISVVKSSVLDTRGMIDTKYRWVRRPQPFTSVGKKQVNYSDYLNYVKQKTISDSIDPICKHTVADCIPCVSKTHRSQYTKSVYTVSNEEYIQKLKSKCTIFDKYGLFSPKTSNAGVAFGTCS